MRVAAAFRPRGSAVGQPRRLWRAVGTREARQHRFGRRTLHALVRADSRARPPAPATAYGCAPTRWRTAHVAPRGLAAPPEQSEPASASRPVKSKPAARDSPYLRAERLLSINYFVINYDHSK